MSGFDLIAQASGCRIYQKGDQVIVMEQPALWIPTARFVLLLIAGIPLIFGVISFFAHLQGADISLWMSIIFIVVGTTLSLVYVFLNKYSKKINSLPPEELTTICVFDLKEKTLLDPWGKSLDSLENISVERQFQLSSSSKKLVVHYTKGTIVLAKGHPFAGGTMVLESVFQELGFMK